MQHLMFRDRNYWESLEKGEITYGWRNFDLSRFRKEEKYKDEVKETLKKSSRSGYIRLIKIFTSIKKEDILIMPYRKQPCFAIGRVKEGPLFSSSEERIQNDSCNYFKVDWFLKSIPYSNLSPEFQSTLKYFGTLLNLIEFQKEINTIVKKSNEGIYDFWGQVKEEEAIEKAMITKKMAEHLIKKENLLFSEEEFESFILFLFELSYGISGVKNSKKQAEKEKKNFLMAIDYDEIGVHINFKIHIKIEDHPIEKETIQKILSGSGHEKIMHIVVTNTSFSKAAKELAEENKWKLFSGLEVAKLITENLDKITDDSMARLGIYKTIKFINRPSP